MSPHGDIIKVARHLSVKSPIRLPANDSLERDIPELQSKTLETWQKGVSRGQEAAGRHTR
jgi:hypothetical protein